MGRTKKEEWGGGGGGERRKLWRKTAEQGQKDQNRKCSQQQGIAGEENWTVALGSEERHREWLKEIIAR